MDKKTCEKCDNELVLKESVDSYLCVICNEWKESQCGDDECEFCKGRSEVPFTKEEHEAILEWYKKFGFRELLNEITKK